jgi:hypothetical protein
LLCDIKSDEADTSARVDSSGEVLVRDCAAGQGAPSRPGMTRKIMKMEKALTCIVVKKILWSENLKNLRTVQQ